MIIKLSYYGKSHVKAINHIKFISKKKPCTLKIFNYLPNNYASNYDYHSVEEKLNELKSNGTTDDSYKIINAIQEVMNFATEDEVIIYTLFFYKQHFYKQHQVQIGKKLRKN